MKKSFFAFALPLAVLLSVGCFHFSNCGDGIQNTDREDCDDANTTSGDGCSSTCTLEVGFICPTPGNACEPSTACGNSILEAGEECDPPNGTTCDDQCRNIVPVNCGNGTVETAEGEQCDLGVNNANSAACTLSCQNARCGDSFVQVGVESCEPPNSATCDNLCNAIIPVTCGNNVVDPGETCDDGNTTSGDGCNASCQDEFCGDGIDNNGSLEQCDDGNTTSGDGCNASCQDEFCGDSIDNDANNEQCDDANSNNNDACTNNCQTARCGDNVVQSGVELCDDGNGSNSDSCLNTCQTPFCGDGFVRSGIEQCDDNNATSGDGCSASCTIESSAVCGNNITEAGEACDDGNGSNTDGCLNNCVLASCGDSFVNAGVEQCDDGNTTSGDGCNAFCQDEFCGDSIDNDANNEQCDDGNTINNDACTNTCQAARCGDSIIQSAEQCDDGNAINNDACSNACRTPFCGDAIIQSGEACDSNTSFCNCGERICNSTCTGFQNFGCQPSNEACD